jgi:hypothetical protein
MPRRWQRRGARSTKDVSSMSFAPNWRSCARSSREGRGGDAEVALRATCPLIVRYQSRLVTLPYWSMSALAHFADSSRTSPEVGEVP